MPNYRNSRWRFSLSLPSGWSEPKGLSRLFRRYDPDNPEFRGPNGTAIKFAIGPFSPAPVLSAHQNNLRRIALQNGHDPIEIGAITVAGMEHATLVYDILKPGMEQLLVLRFKSFHLAFSGVEFVATARLATLPRGISITRPQPPNPAEFQRQKARYADFKRFVKIYAYEEDYDDVIKTFQLC